MKSWTELELRHALDQYESELRSAGKTRNTVNTYVQHPERFINWLVGRYEPNSKDRSPNQDKRATSRSRYDPLRHHLSEATAERVTMSFVEIESILGRRRPASARRHRAWWANDEHGTHTHARAWLRAGRVTEHVDMDDEVVRFVHRDPSTAHPGHQQAGSTA